MEVLNNLLQAPVNTILVLAGIALVFFTFFELNKGNVRMRKTQTNTSLIPATIGAALILGGIFIRPGTAAPPEPTAIPVALTEVSVVTPSTTAPPTDTPAPTTTPSETPPPPTQTASPAPPKTIAENCIASQTWTADSTDASIVIPTPDQNNCLNVSNLGIAASGGALLVVSPGQRGAMAAGIHTDVGDQAEITFNVSIQNLFMVSAGNPAYLSFAIAPKDDAMTKSGSGRFKLQVNDAGNNSNVYFVPADVGEANGVPIGSTHYLYGLSYNVRLKLEGLIMRIYIGESQRPVETVSIPGGSKVFYIGYNIPANASVRATIKDVTIDGQPR